MSKVPVPVLAFAVVAIAGFLTTNGATHPNMALRPGAQTKHNYGSPEVRSKPEVDRPSDASKHETSEEKTTIGNVKCQIEVERSAMQRSIVATATAFQTPESGSFILELQKSGTNSALSRQQGDFTLGRGETKRLAKVRLSVSANDTLSGRLLLNTKDGDTVCDIK